MVRRLATSEPPLGSVIASAEIFLPDRISGSTRALNSGVPARAIGGAPIDWLFRLAETPPAPARASSCTATIHMNWSTWRAAIFLGKAQAQQPDRGGLFIKLARKPAGLVPFVGVGLDLVLDEAAHHVAEGFVFRRVEWALPSVSLQHGSPCRLTLPRFGSA